jgi:hypothetical protein
MILRGWVSPSALGFLQPRILIFQSTYTHIHHTVILGAFIDHFSLYELWDRGRGDEASVDKDSYGSTISLRNGSVLRFTFLAIRLTLVLDDDEERTIIYLDTWRLSLFIAYLTYRRLFNSISYFRFFNLFRPLGGLIAFLVSKLSTQWSRSQTSLQILVSVMLQDHSLRHSSN